MHRCKLISLVLISFAALSVHGVGELIAQEPAPADIPAQALSPAAEALLATGPSTPAERVRAARILVDLGEAAPAKQLIADLLATTPGEATLADLGEQFGSAMFIALRRAPGLDPEATELADAVLSAWERRVRDPARLAALIVQLQDPKFGARERAINELRAARGAAIEALAAVLAEDARAAEHAAVRTALVGQGDEAVAPMIAMLETTDAGLAVQAIEVLRRLEANEAVDPLLALALAPDKPQSVRAAAEAALVALIGHLPSSEKAIAALGGEARRAYDWPPSQTSASEANVDLWSWDDAQRRLISRQASPSLARLERAARLARDARKLAPEDAALRRLHLGALLEAATLAAGVDEELPRGEGSAWSTAAAEGVDAVYDLLAHSLRTNHPAAATTAADLLGEIGDDSLLARGGRRPSALAQAARHADGRLRFAAVRSILKLAPDRPYAGASYVTAALADFISARGDSRALVAGKVIDESQQLAGMLHELGYQSDAVVDPLTLRRMAVSSADYELILIDLPTAWPTSGELLKQLRQDARTRQTPVGVIASPEQLPMAEELARGETLVRALVRPIDPAGMQVQIDRLLADEGPRRLTAAERKQHAAQAMGWIAELAAPDAPRGPKRIYDLQKFEHGLVAALWVPELAPDAVSTLAHMPSAVGQRALVDLASRISQPVELRRAAADAFTASIARHGTLLRHDEIIRQYDRYNASETLDRETQLILGSILDAIEARAARSAGGAPSATQAHDS